MSLFRGATVILAVVVCGLFTACVVRSSLTLWRESKGGDLDEKGNASGATAGASQIATCKMTWMYPSYERINLSVSVQAAFPRYHLWRYHEGQLARQTRATHPSVSEKEFQSAVGIPVLFLPGNAGSYKQVRSIASESQLTAWTQAVRHAREHKSAEGKFDFFAADFDEELSVLDSGILHRQAEFANECIKEIHKMQTTFASHGTPLDVPSPFEVIVIAHSMGGIVARSLAIMPNYLPQSVKTIITLNTPHSAPPLLSQHSMLSLYRTLDTFWAGQVSQEMIIVSLSGGYHDLLVHSKLAVQPNVSKFVSWYTAAIPSVWVDADHEAILWCNQVVKYLNSLLWDLKKETCTNCLIAVKERQNVTLRHVFGANPFYDVMMKERDISVGGPVEMPKANRVDWLATSSHQLQYGSSYEFYMQNGQGFAILITSPAPNTAMSVLGCNPLYSAQCSKLSIEDHSVLLPGYDNPDLLFYIAPKNIQENGFSSLIVQFPKPASASSSSFIASPVNAYVKVIPEAFSLSLFSDHIFTVQEGYVFSNFSVPTFKHLPVSVRFQLKPGSTGRNITWYYVTNPGNEQRSGIFTWENHSEVTLKSHNFDNHINFFVFSHPSSSYEVIFHYDFSQALVQLTRSYMLAFIGTAITFSLFSFCLWDNVSLGFPLSLTILGGTSASILIGIAFLYFNTPFSIGEEPYTFSIVDMWFIFLGGATVEFFTIVFTFLVFHVLSCLPLHFSFWKYKTAVVVIFTSSCATLVWMHSCITLFIVMLYNVLTAFDSTITLKSRRIKEWTFSTLLPIGILSLLPVFSSVTALKSTWDYFEPVALSSLLFSLSTHYQAGSKWHFSLPRKWVCILASAVCATQVYTWCTCADIVGIVMLVLGVTNIVCVWHSAPPTIPAHPQATPPHSD
ncbi:GPI inositol-deacylase [Pelomyxa schiedti]|nr:GPI inositol-deacylase [Pelomyxa schiedti]